MQSSEEQVHSRHKAEVCKTYAMEDEKDNIIHKAEREHVEGLVCFESIADQASRFAVSAHSRGRFKYFLYPFQVDVGVHVALLAAHKLPTRGVITDPVAPEIDRREYDERRQTPNISRDEFNCRDQGSL
jgi:hypothetical protein